MTSTARKNFQPIPLDVERAGKIVLDATSNVHPVLGPGLLDSVYQVAIRQVLESGGTLVETQAKLPMMFEGVKLESGLRLDRLAAKSVIAERRSLEKMNPLYEAQRMTYLRLRGVRLGFLINFKVPHIKEGFKRIID